MKKFINWLKKIFSKHNSEDLETTQKPESPKILFSNLSYIDWIESVERQVLQTKIDFALGSISEEVYTKQMDIFKEKVKEISNSYMQFLSLNDIQLSGENTAYMIS